MAPHLIYYSEDGDAAKSHAAGLRERRISAQVRHARVFKGEAEPCECVVLMPDVREVDAGRLRAAYGEKIGGQMDDIKVVRAEYRRVLGKRPFNGWDVATLKAKIAEAGDGT